MSKNLNVTIFKMQPDDVAEVVRLEALSYGAHHWSEDSFLNEISNNLARYYCLKDENSKILGYIGFWIIFEEAHVTTISVHPEYRHKHLAQTLLTECIECCYREKVKYITLEVRVSNTAAITFYEKFGFSSIGTRKAYYQDNNEDALIMFTENIWYSKFKSIYDKINAEDKMVNVSYGKSFS